MNFPLVFLLYLSRLLIFLSASFDIRIIIAFYIIELLFASVQLRWMIL